MSGLAGCVPAAEQELSQLCRLTLSCGSWLQSEEDFLERRREVERLLRKNADWIWDWSSRPENIPPK